jgi:hypothetical protein
MLLAHVEVVRHKPENLLRITLFSHGRADVRLAALNLRPDTTEEINGKEL